MSLGKELADAVAKSFDVKPGVDRTKIDTMGREMSEAIVKFITNQPFKVQELKAVVELEKLKRLDEQTLKMWRQESIENLSSCMPGNLNKTYGCTSWNDDKKYVGLSANIGRNNET